MTAAAGFDAERYLRLMGERLLVSGDRNRQRGPFGDTRLGNAAKALVAVNAIDAGLAQSVVDDYLTAGAMRESGGRVHRLMRFGPRSGPPAVPAAPTVSRLARCRGVLEEPSGTIECRYALLTSERVEIGVTWRAPPSRTPRRRQRGPHGPSAPHGTGVTATDDRGKSVSCSFTGGGSEFVMTGRFVSTDPLSVETAWLELDGTRLYLERPPALQPVKIAPLTNGSPAHRYLWHTLASGDRWHHNVDIESLIDVLIDAGALTLDDPVLDGVRYVANGRRGPSHPLRGASTGPQRLPETVPPEWRSVLTRTRPAGAQEGSLIVGVTTPEFDAGRVTITELLADGNGFSAEVAIEYNRGGNPFTAARVDESWVVWWAADDRGNWFLGDVGQWSGGGGAGQGTDEFHAALDRHATELRLMPATLRERAVITIPLDWDAEP